MAASYAKTHARRMQEPRRASLPGGLSRFSTLSLLYVAGLVSSILLAVASIAVYL
jgi:hypothetical protein